MSRSPSHPLVASPFGMRRSVRRFSREVINLQNSKTLFETFRVAVLNPSIYLSAESKFYFMRRLIPLLLAAVLALPSLAAASSVSSRPASGPTKWAVLGLGGKHVKRAPKAQKAKKAPRTTKAKKSSRHAKSRR